MNQYKNIFLIFLFSFSFLFSYSQNNLKTLDLMPWPQEINLNQGQFLLNKNLKISINGINSERLNKYTTNFLRRLDGRTGLFINQGFITKSNEFPKANIQITFQKIGEYSIYTDESYELIINSNKIYINTSTDIGAMRALETLLQTLQNNRNSFYFPVLNIKDFPRFKWRGLMLDCARHFQPIEVIKRNLDAMAAMKMNVMHWHLVDDQGWRIELKNNPKLTELASDGLFYTQIQIKEIVKYAKDLGIIVIPEIDVPGHASAILSVYPQIGSNPNQKYLIERNAGIFDPTLDPTNPETYKILNSIFQEVFPLFESEYFHIGGDENAGKEWDTNPKIQEFMKKNNIKNNHELQTYFNMKLLDFFTKNNKKIMGWDEIMTENMSKQAIIHSWRGKNEGMKPGESLLNSVRSGFKTVLSNGFYLDLVLPIKSHYNNESLERVSELDKTQQEMVLGGEATMWSELVTPFTIDSRIWPRTCAIAERLWSNEKITDYDFMLKRLKTISFRLEELDLTHIKNKDVLMRNISNNQNIEPIKEFSKICEPLKVYSRNKGGTEYTTYSPFTLFADVCTPDAENAVIFNKKVDEYLTDKKDDSNKKELIIFLNSWIKNHQDLTKLSENAPLINSFLPLSEQLKNTSELMILFLNNKNINKENLSEGIEKLNSKDFADVELAIYPAFKKLIN